MKVVETLKTQENLEGKMKKAYLNYFIDVGILAAFIVTFVTGIVKWPGIILKFGFNYKDFPMYYFTLFHDWGGLTMAGLSFTHVVLHWKWIVCMTKKIMRGDKNEKKMDAIISISDKRGRNNICPNAE